MSYSVTPPPSSVAKTLRDLPDDAAPSDVWKSAAHALLRIDAEEAVALGEVFEEPTTTDTRRLLLLDLLAGAGTAEAQIAMRRLLSLSVARRNCRVFASFVQRLGLIEAPDGPTLRYLMAVYGESQALPVDVRASCAYALGAAAGHAFAAGDREAALRASDVLRHSLPNASSPEERVGLLTALGNAGLPTDGTLVMRHTEDPDAKVRAAAALALRKIVSPHARNALHTLVSDPDAKVAGSALVALSEHPLSEEDLERVALLILGGKTSPALDARLLRLLAPTDARRRRSIAIEGALRLLLARHVLQKAHASGEYAIAARVSMPPPLPEAAPAPQVEPEVSRSTARTSEADLLAARAAAAPIPDDLKQTMLASPEVAAKALDALKRTMLVAPPDTTRAGSSAGSVAPPPNGSGAYRIVQPQPALGGTAFMPAGPAVIKRVQRG